MLCEEKVLPFRSLLWTLVSGCVLMEALCLWEDIGSPCFLASSQSLSQQEWSRYGPFPSYFSGSPQQVPAEAQGWLAGHREGECWCYFLKTCDSVRQKVSGDLDKESLKVRKKSGATSKHNKPEGIIKETPPHLDQSFLWDSASFTGIHDFSFCTEGCCSLSL